MSILPTFSFDGCNKTFSQVCELNVYAKIHTVGKSFICDAACGEEFSRKSNLNKHLWIHTGTKLFSCKMCIKGFPNKSEITICISILEENLSVL